jgi:hypothetical protein
MPVPPVLGLSRRISGRCAAQLATGQSGDPKLDHVDELLSQFGRSNVLFNQVIA